MKSWFRRLLRLPRTVTPIEEELWVAEIRLMSDPRITEYTMINGCEHRQPTLPWRDIVK